MPKIGNYLTLAWHKYIFGMGYDLLQKNSDDRELLAVTFDHGIRAIWALDDLKKEDKELSDKVHELSKQVREKKIGRDDAPYLFPPLGPYDF